VDAIVTELGLAGGSGVELTVVAMAASLGAADSVAGAAPAPVPHAASAAARATADVAAWIRCQGNRFRAWRNLGTSDLVMNAWVWLIRQG
jgi:hypothetical protein